MLGRTITISENLADKIGYLIKEVVEEQVYSKNPVMYDEDIMDELEILEKLDCMDSDIPTAYFEYLIKNYQNDDRAKQVLDKNVPVFNHYDVDTKDYYMQKELETITCDEPQYAYYFMDKNGMETMNIQVHLADKSLERQFIQDFFDARFFNFSLDENTDYTLRLVTNADKWGKTTHFLSIEGRDVPKELNGVDIPVMSKFRFAEKLDEKIEEAFDTIEKAIRTEMERYRADGYGQPNFEYSDYDGVGILKDNDEVER